MKEHDIVSAVADAAQLSDHAAAVRAVQATIHVLGARLAGGQAANLAAQLPASLAELLPRDAPGERFDVREFYQRVAERENLHTTVEQARQHARATLAALKVTVTGRQFAHLSAQLPRDYADLLGTEPVQHH